MSILARPKPGVATPSDRPRSSPRFADHAPGLLLVCLVGGLVMAFFLGVYLVKQYPMPIGYDTPRYLDQTGFVAERGLAGVPHLLPPPIKTLASRAGFPLMVLSLSSLFAGTTFQLAATVPVAAAAALALACGALVSVAMRRSPWDLALITAVVGTSTVLIRLMGPELYTDNVLAAALFVAGMVAVVSVVRNGRGFAAAILLLGVGGLAHAPTFAEVLAILAIVAAVYAATSWRQWRREDVPLLATPTGRLGLVVGGSAALTAAGIWGLLRTGPDTPKLTRYELSKKIREDVPLYRFWLSAPLAAVGAAGLVAGGLGSHRGEPSADPEGEDDARRGARFLLALLAAWCVVTAAGLLWYLTGRLVPAHRFLAFLLPLPILMAVGILAVARMVCARTTRWAGVALAVVALTGLSALGYRLWYVDLPRDRGLEWMDLGKIQAAATAARYLDVERIPDSAPVVFIIDDTGPNPLSYVPEMTYMIRAVLPPDRIPHAYIDVGDPEDYLAGRPTQRSTPKTYNANVHRFWPTVRALLPRHPVALLLDAYNPAFHRIADAHPDWEVAPGVVALSGPRPAAQIATPPIPTGPRGAVRGGALGIGTLVVLTLAGLGWAVALLPGGMRSFEVLALAPALGIAFVLLAGVLLDSAGVRLTGFGGALAVLLPGAAGLAAGWARLRRRGLDLFPAR